MVVYTHITKVATVDEQGQLVLIHDKQNRKSTSGVWR